EKNVAETIFAVENGQEVGFALYFYNFSTFVGKAGLYLEDLYVYPEHRGKGYGKALFIKLVETAVERGCGRMEWVCLNWNEPSIRFYRSMGAIPMDEWTTYRLTEDKLQLLANK
ncbi:MAG: GNAT family N-acetyltransferase, partial [Bacteroidales bacterium]|nr:GNAT family N-acetyltransferase [Bacteroidales bacterium]